MNFPVFLISAFFSDHFILHQKTWIKLSITNRNINTYLCSMSFANLNLVLLKISQNSQEYTCTRVPFLIKLQSGILQLYEKENAVQVLSYEFFKIFKNIYSTIHLRTTASGLWRSNYTEVTWKIASRNILQKPARLLRNSSVICAFPRILWIFQNNYTVEHPWKTFCVI